MKPAIAYSAIGMGFVLLALSGAWSTLFPATSNWTPDKEQRWQQVKARIHTLSFVVGDPQRVSMHGGPETGQAKAEYDKLKQEDGQLRDEFESAANRPNTISKTLKWSGISLAAVGIIGWYAVKNTS